MSQRGKCTGQDGRTNKIQRANLDGSNVEDLISGLDGPSGIALGIPPQLPPTPTNQPPIFEGKIANITATVGVALSPVTLPPATDPEGETVNYSLAPTLPAGLQFNSATRLLSGTPTAAMAAATYTYTASDGINSTSLTFEITVTADSAPTFGGQTIAPISATVGTAIAPIFLPEATDCRWQSYHVFADTGTARWLVV